MIEKEVKIENRLGLHARAAAKLVHLAARFECEVKVRRDHQEVNGKSILGILMLAASQGTALTVSCDGRDEELAMEAIVGLIANRFDEDQAAS